MLLLSLPPVFLLGEIDRSLWGVGYSSEGLRVGLQIALRFIVVLIALNGLTGSVEITAIAGLLERGSLDRIIMFSDLQDILLQTSQLVDDIYYIGYLV